MVRSATNCGLIPDISPTSALAEKPTVDTVGMKVVSWPTALLRHGATKRPHVLNCAAAGCRLDLGLLGDLQRIVHINAEVANRTFQLGMAKEQLNGPQVLRAAIDQGCLGSPHRVHPIGR